MLVLKQCAALSLARITRRMVAGTVANMQICLEAQLDEFNQLSACTEMTILSTDFPQVEYNELCCSLFQRPGCLVLTAGTSWGNTAVVTASAASDRFHPGWCGDLLVQFKHSGLLELSSLSRNAVFFFW